jgi:hypothetical protein
MATAPTRLGGFVAREGTSDVILLRRLREEGLVRPEAADADIIATFQAARDEHEAGRRSPYNSPEERVRVFLEPYLTEKGHVWADHFAGGAGREGSTTGLLPSALGYPFAIVRRNRSGG